MNNKEPTTLIEIYSDGSCRKNGTGGYASYNLNTDTIVYGKATNTTNNRMELYAAISAIENIKDYSKVVIYSDSKYVVNCINSWVNDWYKSNKISMMKNNDLLRLLKIHLDRLIISAIWVKGHADNKYNNLCDQIAQEVSN